MVTIGKCIGPQSLSSKNARSFREQALSPLVPEIPFTGSSDETRVVEGGRKTAIIGPDHPKLSKISSLFKPTYRVKIRKVRTGKWALWNSFDQLVAGHGGLL